MENNTYDYVIIGSGFGGSVSAMRLIEKGYTVLVLERGKRFYDEDFPKTNLEFWKHLWAPKLRSFGILQLTLFQDVLVMNGSGVGGGSLGYANVLMQPDEKFINAPAWKHLADWKSILMPHYKTVRGMMGVTRNPRLWIADEVIQEIATELGVETTFRPTEVSVFFGKDGTLKEGQEVPDPYFNGQGPKRNTCNYCGGCLVGCRNNAKNTLVKNYLYFAEKWGAEIRAESQVHDVRPLPPGQPDGARYEVAYHRSTAWLRKPERTVRARNVIFSAGTIGTLDLLLRCRDVNNSLPKISPRLGERVRTNSEAFLGATSRNWETDYSKGVAITSVFQADEVTAIEPVRYPAGSSLLRVLAGPLIESGENIPIRILKNIAKILSHPLDFIRAHILPGWAYRTTILLVMQTEDNYIRVRLGRNLYTLFRKGLITQTDEENKLPSKIDIGHRVTHAFARKTNGIPAGSLNEGILNTPVTAHFLGGCPIGNNDQEGVVDLDFQVHNYPGLYVVDGSIMPANPGINPSLTIAALAEYAMSRIPPKPDAPIRQPLGVADEEKQFAS